MKHFSKIFSVMICALTLLLCAGCWYSFESSEDGTFRYGLGIKDVFLIEYVWDGESETRVELPDTIAGLPVTTLGGYTGRGYPCPFRVKLPDSYSNCDFVASSGVAERDETGEIIEIDFTLVLGSNLNSLYYLCDDYYPWLNEDGTYTYYHLVYRYEVAKDSATFYAENGVLYEKKTGKIAEWEYTI